MKKILSLLVVLCIGITVLYARNIKGNGNIVKQERAVAAFSSIEAGSVFCIFIKQGQQLPLVIETDENLQQMVSANVSGDRLNLTISGGINHISKLNVYISMPQLTRLDLSGVAKATFQTPFENVGRMQVELSGSSTVKDLRVTAEDLDVKLHGSSKMDLNTTNKKTNLNLSGSIKLNLNGSSETLRVTGAGVSKLDADFKASKSIDMEISGASKVSGKLYTDIIKVVASGASSVNLGGQWDKQQLSASGSANINTEQALCRESEVDASGASVIAMSKTTITKISTSGASRIRTQGSGVQAQANDIANVQSLVASLLEQNAELLNNLDIHLENIVVKMPEITDTQAKDLQKMGDEFVELTKKLGEQAQQATFKINGKTYLVKDAKISTLKNKDGSVSLFINGEEVYKFQ